MKLAGWALLLLALFSAPYGCGSPSDVLFDDPPFRPVEVEPGVFRVTYGSGPAVARGFLPDGRLLFRAYDLPPLGSDWVLISVPPDGGYVREEARLYRAALFDDLGHLTTDGGRRLLTLWKTAIPGTHGCPDSSLTVLGTPGPAPRTPSPVGITIFGLPETDGIPVGAIPSRFVSTGLVEGAGTTRQRVRVHPAARDVDRTGANAFGPVLLPGGMEMIYSDGQELWRAATVDTSAQPRSLGPGAYPALRPDGRMLVYARPTGLDSTVRTFTIPAGLTACVEEYVEISATSWEVVSWDLDSDLQEVLVAGLDPAIDPLGGRLVVRTGQLEWLDLEAGTTSSIPGTTDAFAPSVSLDGKLLAFSRFNGPSNSDVYFVRLSR